MMAAPLYDGMLEKLMGSGGWWLYFSTLITFDFKRNPLLTQ